MTTTDTEPAAGRLTSVTAVYNPDGDTAVLTAETTPSPHLVISPGLAQDGTLIDGWTVRHARIGLVLPAPWDAARDLTVLRAYAADLAALDGWQHDDASWYASDDPAAIALKEAMVAAMRKRSLITPEPQEIPAPDGDDLRAWGRLPKDAHTTIGQSLDRVQQRFSAALDDDHPLHVDLPRGDDVDRDSPEYRAASRAYMTAIEAMCATFDVAYLLAALQRIDPAAADSATTFLARQHESGDTVGEWVYEWRQAYDAGLPLNLPGIPGPSTPPPSALLQP